MEKMMKKYLNSIARGLTHILGSAAVIFAVGWMAVSWAERGNRPQAIELETGAETTLTAKDATIKGAGGARFENFSNLGNIGYWSDPSQSLEWNLKARQSEKYRVTLAYSLPMGMSTELKVISGESELIATVTGEGNWASWQSLDIGELSITHGEQPLKLIPLKLHQEEGVMNFVSLTLRPID